MAATSPRSQFGNRRQPRRTDEVTYRDGLVRFRNPTEMLERRLSGLAGATLRSEIVVQ